MSGFVQNGTTVSQGSGTNSPTITGVASGNTLISFQHLAGGGAISAPTDSAGQTWTSLVSLNNSAGSVCIAYLLNANSGTHTLTWATQSVGNTSAISEWNGITGTGGTPVSNASSGSVTSFTSSSYTPGSSSEVVIAIGGEAGGPGTNDGLHVTTAGFQTIGGDSDSASHSCWGIQQNGGSFDCSEANAQIITSSSALTCSWAWTPSNSASAAVGGFTFTAAATFPVGQILL